MKLSAVIFDWAGTMVDFGSIAPVIAMRKAFAQEGIGLTDSEIRSGMGLAKRDHVAAILGTERVTGAWSARQGRDAVDADVDRIFETLAPLMADAGADRATLIPGAAETARVLRGKGIRVGSTTGYTRAMMEPILERAAAQGYAPEVVVCAGEATAGRPAPFMIWRALETLGCWPTASVLKVDDAPVGILEGRNAGCLTVGVAASGNALGLDADSYAALTGNARTEALTGARHELASAGADFVIDTVDDLLPLLESNGLI
ncbi:MAG: phosphonoacetaldehyde hydrolase [Phenylobacterium sp.]|uniref:phosphonoacetaldehyde hydrolase n=1 Tax=Phenylobacterium sp. TaxID=1871053 RepID=UPI0030182E00